MVNYDLFCPTKDLINKHVFTIYDLKNIDIYNEIISTMMVPELFALDPFKLPP